MCYSNHLTFSNDRDAPQTAHLGRTIKIALKSQIPYSPPSFCLLIITIHDEEKKMQFEQHAKVNWLWMNGDDPPRAMSQTKLNQEKRKTHKKSVHGKIKSPRLKKCTNLRWCLCILELNIETWKSWNTRKNLLHYDFLFFLFISLIQTFPRSLYIQSDDFRDFLGFEWFHVQVRWRWWRSQVTQNHQQKLIIAPSLPDEPAVFV